MYMKALPETSISTSRCSSFGIPSMMLLSKSSLNSGKLLRSNLTRISVTSAYKRHTYVILFWSLGMCNKAQIDNKFSVSSSLYVWVDVHVCIDILTFS